MAIFAAVLLLAGCKTTQTAELDVHPAVFEMVRRWLSDWAEPVVTEVNLDAVARNRNQFDPDEVRRYREWIHADESDGRGFYRYRVLGSEGSVHRILYQSNGGGTLTTSAILRVELAQREVEVNGQLVPLRVLRVFAISDLDQPLKHPDLQHPRQGAR